jgi:Ca2+-transporting ATPase
VSLIAIIAVTTIGILERIVGTGSLTGRQWGICIAIAASLLVIEELLKLILRNRAHSAPPAASSPVPS